MRNATAPCASTGSPSGAIAALWYTSCPVGVVQGVGSMWTRIRVSEGVGMPPLFLSWIFEAWQSSPNSYTPSTFSPEPSASVTECTSST